MEKKFMTLPNHEKFLAKKLFDGAENIVGKDNSFYVKGSLPHSIWNNGNTTAKVIKISVGKLQD